MDETPIQFELISKTTITKICSRSVNVKTFGSDRKRFSLILCIGAVGEKLPPLLFFSAQKNATLEKRLQSYADSKKNKMYVLCQPNGWADNEIFLFWLKNVLFNNRYVPNTKPKLLIMDRATTHYDANLVETFKAQNSSYILIPPGLTRFIQPLDVSINGPFKKAMIHWDTEFRISHMNIKKPDYNDVIDAVYENWYSEDKITKEIIIRSFKCTGISIALDGSENGQMVHHEEVSEEIISPEDILEDLKENSLNWEDDMKNEMAKKKKTVNDKKVQPSITDFFYPDRKSVV